jgi:hypothetical protein
MNNLLIRFRWSERCTPFYFMCFVFDVQPWCPAISHGVLLSAMTAGDVIVLQTFYVLCKNHIPGILASKSCAWHTVGYTKWHTVGYTKWHTAGYTKWHTVGYNKWHTVGYISGIQ